MKVLFEGPPIEKLHRGMAGEDSTQNRFERGQQSAKFKREYFFFKIKQTRSLGVNTHEVQIAWCQKGGACPILALEDSAKFRPFQRVRRERTFLDMDALGGRGGVDGGSTWKLGKPRRRTSVSFQLARGKKRSRWKSIRAPLARRSAGQ